jgi:hypothetical protein
MMFLRFLKVMRLLFWATSVLFALFVLWQHFGRLCAGILALGYLLSVLVDDYLRFENDSM